MYLIDLINRKITPAEQVATLKAKLPHLVSMYSKLLSSDRCYRSLIEGELVKLHGCNCFGRDAHLMHTAQALY